MQTLTERLEVRVNASTMPRLRDAAARQGVSVGQVVRHALTRELGEDRAERERAAEALFAVGAAVGDWPEMERETEEAHGPCGD
jgi:hypothetical protein